MEEARSQSPHIALLSDAGTSHLIPIASLAKHLLNKLKFSVTLITQPTSHFSHSNQAIINTLPKEINVVPLPQIPAEEIPKGRQSTGTSILIGAHNLHHLRDVLTSLLSSNPNTILIVDIFGAIAHDVAREVGVPLYLFFSTSCMVLSLAQYVVKLDAASNGQFPAMPELIRMPGCGLLHERDLPEAFHDRDREAFKEFLKFLKTHFLAKAILVNSVEELESGAIGALKADETVPPVYAIGPVLWLGSSRTGGGPERPDCLKWLDKQPEGSVIYVSFGSGGTLTCEQMGELALGLEMSGQRFLWVVRCPNESDASGDYFGVTNVGRSPIEFLPEGFIERTKGIGQVVPTWAPQWEILSHGATGGFVSHCGWSSCLEGIVNGVPMIAWPLFAEQRTNAVLLTEDLKLAARIRVGEDGVVRREAIDEMLRDVMEGEVGRGLRKRMKEAKEAASSALDDGGSSGRALSEIARDWNNMK